MYLSQCRIDARYLINPYQVHRLLWKQFPNDPYGSRPFLFQMEKLGRGRARYGEILMLSTRKPLSTDAVTGVALLASKPYRPRFVSGQAVGFRLDANPVKRLNQTQNRVPLLREEERIAWLQRKLEGVATLQECSMTAGESLFFRKQRSSGKIVKVRFEGVLKVDHAMGLCGLIEYGIGPAKAFGCGLLLMFRT